MATQKKKFPAKLIIIVFLLIGLIYYSFVCTGRFLLTSEYFRIEKVITNNPLLDLSYLKGQNIFQIDLAILADDLYESFPNYRKITVTRELPDTISVDFVSRQAIGYVKLYRYFAVDDQAVLFYPQDKQLNPQLPIIEGLETRIFGPRPGQKVNVNELKTVIDLIKSYNNIKELREYKISRIIASDISNLSFFISHNVQIKVGSTLRGKLRILRSLLREIQSELDKVRYIDLRFKEPVIKYAK